MKYRKLIRHPAVFITIGLMLTAIAVLIGTPYLIQNKLNKWIVSHGPDRSITENVDFNYFTGKFALYNLQVETQRGRTLHIPKAHLKFSWRNLFHNRIYLDELILEDSFLVVDTLENTDFRIAGLVVKELIGTSDTRAKESSAWGVGIKRFEILNSKIEYDTPQLAATYYIDRYRLTDLESWNKQQPVKVELQGRIDDSPIQINAEITPFAEQLVTKGRLQLQKAKLSLISNLLAMENLSVEGQIDINATVESVRQDDELLDFSTDGNISISTVQLAYNDMTFSEDSINWQGTLSGTKSPAEGVTLTAEGNLHSANPTASLPSKSMAVQSRDLQWQGSVNYQQQQKDEVLDFSTDGNFSLSALQLSYNDMTFSEDSINWQGTLSGAKSPAEGFTLTAEGNLNSANLTSTLPSKSMAVQSRDLQWQGSVNYQQRKNSPSLIMTANLEGAQVTVGDTTRNMRILDFEGFAVNSLDIKALKDISIGEVILQKLLVMSKEIGETIDQESEENTLLQAEKMRIQNIRWQDFQKLFVSDITASTFQAYLKRQKEGGWYLLDTAPAPDGQKDEAEKPAAEDEPSEAKPSLQLKHLQLQDKGSVRFEDETTFEPYSATIEINELQIQNIDTTDTSQPLHLKLAGTIGGYSNVSFEGTALPFAKPLSLDIKGKIDAFDMPPLSSYTGQTIGYNITSGQMDAESNIKIDKGLFGGNTELRMRNLEVARQDPDKTPNIDNQIKVPLESGLAMLRDKKDVIKLDIELKGDIENPEFSFQDAINQAIAKATTFASVNFLKYTLQPFGTYIALAEIIGKAGKKVTKVQLDPVQFKAAETHLDETAKQYLEKVAIILKNRPKIRLEICGKAVENDRISLLSRREAEKKESEKKMRGSKKETAIVSDITDEELQELAKERARLVKDSLVNVHGVEHDRIYLCLPAIDKTPEKGPFVELLID
jgi:hypothetical protein